MSFCSNCGNEIPDGVLFCGACGLRLEGKEVLGSAADVNPADEIRSFKELMNQGIISSEEFEAKKKQLLGL